MFKLVNFSSWLCTLNINLTIFYLSSATACIHIIFFSLNASMTFYISKKQLCFKALVEMAIKKTNAVGRCCICFFVFLICWQKEGIKKIPRRSHWIISLFPCIISLFLHSCRRGQNISFIYQYVKILITFVSWQIVFRRFF